MGAQIEEKKRVNYPDLDVMKLVMAFFVVEIHTRPFLGWPAIELLVEGLEVVAVPFFFLASAFLCFRGLTLNDFASYGSKGAVRVRRTIGKLLWLYLVWTALYLPVTIYGDLLTGKGLIQSVGLFVRGTVFVGENFCSWPLWYLLASVLAFSLVYLFFRGGGISKENHIHRCRFACHGVLDKTRTGVERCACTHGSIHQNLFCNFRQHAQRVI